MSSQTIPYPFTSDVYLPEGFSIKVEDMVLLSMPSLGGQIRTYELPGTWLVATITYGFHTTAERQELMGLWAKAGLRKNRVSLYHPLYPAPRGSMRGTPTVTSNTAAGAEAVPITGTGTLERGDFIGLTDGLHIVTDPVTLPASAVPISPQLRAAVAAGSAVTWDRPTQTFVPLAAPDIPTRGSGMHPGFTVQLVEAP